MQAALRWGLCSVFLELARYRRIGHRLANVDAGAFVRMFRLMTGALGKPDTRRGQDVLVDARPDRSGSTNQCDRPNLSLTKDYENLLLAKPLRDGRCPVASARRSVF
jgi:hypothetical protein